MTAQDLIREARNYAECFDHALSPGEIALLHKSHRLNIALADALEATIENFADYVTSGTSNPAPYCANACKDCVDGRGWCKEDRSTCKGFAVRTGGAG